MGAQMRGAARHAGLDQITGAFLGGDRQVRQDRLVCLLNGRIVARDGAVLPAPAPIA
jgi:hypothetical protein